MEKTLTQSDLTQFTGTEKWYRHNLMRSILYTEGVKYLADHGGAHWLIDKVATSQLDASIAREPFQAWTLSVDTDKNTGMLTVDDGNGNTIYNEKLHFTDFPLPTITLWFTDNVILLPSEY